MSIKVPLLRVKRRRSQEPIEALQLSSPSASKKGKFEEKPDNPTHDKLTFTLAATLEKDHDHGHLEKVLRGESKLLLRKDPKKPDLKDIKVKMRETKAKIEEKKRFQILKGQRGIPEEEEDHPDKKVKCYDVIESKSEVITCNGLAAEKVVSNVEEPKEDEEQEDFVYDVYKMEKQMEQDLDDAFFDRITSIEALETVSGLLQDYKEDDEDLFQDDSDSNDEDNWRNDYPDEEEYADFVLDGKSSDEEDEDGLYGQLMGDMKLSDGEEEEEEENLIHSRSFQQDADMHGEGYARFKHMIVKDDEDDNDDNDDIDKLDEF